MYTDFYFTNKSSLNQYIITLFQKRRTIQNIDETTFEVIKNCPYNWSNKVRICWNICFRLVDQFHNLSPLYYLDFRNTRSIKTHLIFKEGALTIKQHSQNGDIIVDFEQTKGNKIQAIHFYRGNLLIDQQLFENKTLKFKASTIISLTQFIKNEAKSMIDIDIVGHKAVYIHLKENQNTGNKFQLIKQDKW